VKRCPVCAAHVASFDPLFPWLLEALQEHGYPYDAEDAETMNVAEYQCPDCLAADRERMYAVWIDRHAPKGGRLLEVGPTPPFSRFLKQRFNHRSLDQDGRGDDIGDVQHLPYPDGSFDAIVCSHVLEHVPDDRAALREIRRVLKRDGWAILMVPVCRAAPAIDETSVPVSQAEAWRRFGQYDHMRLYNKPGWLERLDETGFRIREWKPGPVTRHRYAIKRGSTVYICT
jgi:SAM-dependent methyltransferase